MKRVVLAVAVSVAAVAGCSNGVTWNSPTKKVTKEQMLADNARRGYTEVRREKVIYVVSSPDAKKRVADGKDPAMKVAAIGYGPNGEKVIFEDSKDGLATGLMAEFERRHGGGSEDASAKAS